MPHHPSATIALIAERSRPCPPPPPRDKHGPPPPVPPCRSSSTAGVHCLVPRAPNLASMPRMSHAARSPTQDAMEAIHKACQNRLSAKRCSGKFPKKVHEKVVQKSRDFRQRLCQKLPWRRRETVSGSASMGDGGVARWIGGARG